MKKENEFCCLFGHNIISNGLYQVIRNNIETKKTTELVLLFHIKTTKLVFLWPNMSQKKHESVDINCRTYPQTALCHCSVQASGGEQVILAHVVGELQPSWIL